MNSHRFFISEIILAAVQAPDVFELRPPPAPLVDVQDNPIGPIAGIEGDRLLIIKERFDTLNSVESGQEARIYVFDLVTINRSKKLARKLADIDHCAAEVAVKLTLKKLDEKHGVRRISERQKVFDLEGFDPGGALIIGTYEVDYRTPKSAR